MKMYLKYITGIVGVCVLLLLLILAGYQQGKDDASWWWVVVPTAVLVGAVIGIGGMIWPKSKKSGPPPIPVGAGQNASSASPAGARKTGGAVGGVFKTIAIVGSIVLVIFGLTILGTVVTPDEIRDAIQASKTSKPLVDTRTELTLEPYKFSKWQRVEAGYKNSSYPEGEIVVMEMHSRKIVRDSPGVILDCLVLAPGEELGPDAVFIKEPRDPKKGCFDVPKGVSTSFAYASFEEGKQVKVRLEKSLQ